MTNIINNNMNAFISYSHNDTAMLDLLHKHLVQLQRERIISTWTDNEIPACGSLNSNISTALNNSNIFIALLSPDYIASNYCYENEFQKALEMQEQDGIIIVPIILEPCDWLNTPFKEFKALPKDGKPVSTWENKNTAFLDVIQNIRKLVSSPEPGITKTALDQLEAKPIQFSRNYRVKKDFDSIEKMEFIEVSFSEVKEYLKRYLEEILQIDNIKARTLHDTNKEFHCLLINRNKINTESHLKISINSRSQSNNAYGANNKDLSYSINETNSSGNNGFSLSFDEFHLFWSENSYFNSRDKKELSTKDIADKMWSEWLESVGIL